MPSLNLLMPIAIAGGTTGGITIGITTVKAPPKLQVRSNARPLGWRPL
jgi:hypothetical protein